MKRYIHNLKPVKYVENEPMGFGEDYVPLNKVEEMLSDIEDEIYLVEDLIEKNKIGDAIDKLEFLREKL